MNFPKDLLKSDTIFDRHVRIKYYSRVRKEKNHKILYIRFLCSLNGSRSLLAWRSWRGKKMRTSGRRTFSGGRCAAESGVSTLWFIGYEKCTHSNGRAFLLCGLTHLERSTNRANVVISLYLHSWKKKKRIVEKKQKTTHLTIISASSLISSLTGCPCDLFPCTLEEVDLSEACLIDYYRYYSIFYRFHCINVWCFEERGFWRESSIGNLVPRSIIASLHIIFLVG